MPRTKSKYSVKSLIEAAYEASTLENANFSTNPEEDVAIKKVISPYMKTWIEAPLKRALEKLNKNADK
jgi:hypothetical protein